MRFSNSFYACLASVIFLLDFISKILTHFYLPLMVYSSPYYPYGGIGIFENLFGIEFSLSHTTNKGAAWGYFAHFQEILIVFRIVLVLFLIYSFISNAAGRVKKIALTLITTGAIGNVVDNFIYGHVIDMFHFVLWNYDFPVFNVADSAIFIGICLWIFFSVSPSSSSGSLSPSPSENKVP